MVLPILSIGAGLVLLAGGADILVRGATSIARRVGISPLVIGLTVVAMATSLPELLVSVGAALRGSPGVALGNVVGSNIANIGLILGCAALLGPIGVKAQIIRTDAPILVGCSLAVIAVGVDGTLSRVDGLILFAALVGYVVYSVYVARREPRAAALQAEFETGLPQQHALWLDLIYLVGGLAGLLLGAHLLVDGAVLIASTLGVPDVIVGLTVVAVGTSLPELATSAAAAYRGEGDIAIGNAVGSSIFNLLGILGLTVVIHPLDTGGFRALDALIMTGFAAALLPLLRTGLSLSRREGAALVAAYTVYIASMAFA
ncbi:calcium/sodium antiporter [Longibacter sp.]|uniref:calcium/sodium antiporter n=1 Tax=Longibacter sp. TaxID=2045415 RepID=UPI003EBDEE37